MVPSFFETVKICYFLIQLNNGQLKLLTINIHCTPDSGKIFAVFHLKISDYCI